MKHVKYLSIFIILSLLGFYIGSQSEILGQGLLFAEVEERGPASPDVRNQELFLEAFSTTVDKVMSMTSVDGIELCELIGDLDKYTVRLSAAGMSSGDLATQLSIEGRCITRGKLVVFDSTICDETDIYNKLRPGLSGGSGAVTTGYNLDSTIPFDKLSFVVSSLTVIYNDGVEEEPALGELPTLYSCGEPVE